MRDAGARRWWTAPVNTAGTVLWRLPGALLGAVLFVAAGGMLGPPGLLLALIWLLTGALTGFRFGERVLARTVLRYRPAGGSWLEAEVRRLLPGRRVDVYVAPKAVGVFALGGHTIGLGETLVGSGAPTPALLAAAAAAARELSAGRTRPELPLLWWGVPWWFARQIPGHLVPGRLQPLLKVWAVGVAVVAVVNGVRVGHPSVIVLVALAATDLCIRGIRGRRQRRQHRLNHPRLQPVRRWRTLSHANEAPSSLVLAFPGAINDDGQLNTPGSMTVLSRTAAKPIVPLLRPTGATFELTFACGMVSPTLMTAIESFAVVVTADASAAAVSYATPHAFTGFGGTWADRCELAKHRRGQVTGLGWGWARWRRRRTVLNHHEGPDDSLVPRELNPSAPTQRGVKFRGSARCGRLATRPTSTTVPAELQWNTRNDT